MKRNVSRIQKILSGKKYKITKKELERAMQLPSTEHIENISLVFNDGIEFYVQRSKNRNKNKNE